MPSHDRWDDRCPRPDSRGVANARGAPSLVDVQHQHLRVVPAWPRADVAVGLIWKD